MARVLYNSRVVGRPVVMIVDDDCEIRELLQEALGSERFDVVCCSDGAEALRIIGENGPPALLLVDLMMPVMNGWELVAHLQRDAALRSIPFLVMTAAGSHWGYPVPPERVVQKPFDVDALLRHVSAAIAPSASA